MFGMTVGDAAQVAALLAALGIGSLATALFNWISRRETSHAEADSIVVNAAESVVTLVTNQFESMQVRLEEMEEEIAGLMTEVNTLVSHIEILAGELHDLGVDPDAILYKSTFTTEENDGSE